MCALCHSDERNLDLEDRHDDRDRRRGGGRDRYDDDDDSEDEEKKRREDEFQVTHTAQRMGGARDMDMHRRQQHIGARVGHMLCTSSTQAHISPCAHECIACAHAHVWLHMHMYSVVKMNGVHRRRHKQMYKPRNKLLMGNQHVLVSGEHHLASHHHIVSHARHHVAWHGMARVDVMSWYVVHMHMLLSHVLVQQATMSWYPMIHNRRQHNW